MDVQVRFATTSDGVNIAYHTFGEGPPLVLLPVLPSMSHLQAEWESPYRDFMLAVGAGYQVIRYDSRGLGLSDEDPPSLSLDAHLLDLLAVLDRLGLPAVSMVAAHYAAPIAIAFAARFPSRVTRLVLWCAFATYEEVLAAMPVETARQREALVAIASTAPEVALRAYTQFAGGWGEGEGAAGFADLAMKSIPLERFFERLKVYAAFDAREDLASVGCPTLVQHRPGYQGSHVSVARRLAAKIPGASLELFEGSSNVPFVGDGEAVVRSMREFIGRPPQT